MNQQSIFSAREFQKLNALEKKKNKKPIKHEEKIQMRLCEYVRVKYPHVIFECDLASGTKLTIGQAVKAKAMRSNRGMPDFRIFHKVGRYNGLFLELKKEGEKLFKKDESYASDHIQEQSFVIKRLQAQGYEALFAIGFKEACEIVDDYMKLKF